MSKVIKYHKFSYKTRLEAEVIYQAHDDSAMWFDDLRDLWFVNWLETIIGEEVS